MFDRVIAFASVDCRAQTVVVDIIVTGSRIDYNRPAVLIIDYIIAVARIDRYSVILVVDVVVANRIIAFTGVN